jgi:hypothetical protein
MKQVIVQLAATALPGSGADGHQAAFERAKDFGVTLQAIHPGSDDPALSRWFCTEVENAKAPEFVESLRKIPEVTAAYVKPRAEPP